MCSLFLYGLVEHCFHSRLKHRCVRKANAAATLHCIWQLPFIDVISFESLNYPLKSDRYYYSHAGENKLRETI